MIEAHASGVDTLVVRVLEDEEPVAEADGERASAPAFADPDAHDRHSSRRSSSSDSAIAHACPRSSASGPA